MSMEDEPVQLSEPLLAQNSQYEKERRSLLRTLRDGKHGLLAAAASHTGLSYARTRSLLLKMKMKERVQRSGASWGWGILLWPFGKLKELEQYKSNSTLPIKAGLAAMVAGLLCFAPGFLSVFNKNGMWGVITVDIVLEANVGLTFSKGLNRTLGTLLAAVLAILVDLASDQMGWFRSYFLLICTFLGGAIPTMFKFRRPFKDRWNYAVVMSMITFHLLILTKTDQRIQLPLIRLALIGFGFIVASVVNIAILPNFAGNNVNNLIGTNFERAGNVMERCVLEYCQGTVLQQVPDMINHTGNDELHACFHEIMAADSEVEKLLGAAKFEPPHGKFILQYPWYLYNDVTHNLRVTLYDVVALDSCLRAEIQAPLHLRYMFQTEFMALGKECAEVLRAVGKTMHTMKQHDTRQILERSEEVALLLQHKIAKYADVLLQGAPCGPAPHDTLNKRTEGFLTEVLEARSMLSESSDNESYVASSIDEMEQPPDPMDMSQPELHHEMSEEQQETEKKIGERMPTLEGRAGEFLKRRGSIGDHWETTIQRLAALSLLKFAALLIEVAAKSKYVVNVIDELAEKAHFDKPSPGDSKPSKEFVSAFGTL